MGNRMLNFRSKKGTTMVEVLAAVVILALVVTAVLSTIGFSQRTILSKSTESGAAAQAQEIADALIKKLHGADADSLKTVEVLGAKYVENADFPDPSSPDDKQFTFIPVEKDADGIEGYRIKAAVYFTDGSGRKCVQMTAFSAKDGDAS